MHARTLHGTRGSIVARLGAACLAAVVLVAPVGCEESADMMSDDPGNVARTASPGGSAAPGGGSGAGTPAGRASLDDLLAVLASGGTWDRVGAIGDLAVLGDPAAVPAVTAALADPSWDVRLAAATALVTLGDDRAVDGLLALLAQAAEPSAIDPADQPTAEEAAGAAVDALGAIGDPGAAVALAGLLADPSPVVDAVQVTAALVAIGPDGLAGIRRAIRDAPAAGAVRVVPVLGEIGEPALDALGDVARDRRAQVRIAAVEALGGLGKDAVPVLVKALKDANDDVRSAAAGSLGNIGSPRATEGLVRLLGDTATRRAAVRALVRIHRDDARPLVKYLADRDSVQVYRPLIKIGQGNTVPALVRALKRFGTKTMGETYLNCGEPRLEKAAREWAASHGYRVVPSGYAGEEAWGVS
jgi:HEAT repeat protein